MLDLYPIGAVSKLTGISIDTLRAWERRYSAVVPKRGDKKRGYDREDIERLTLLRRVVGQGHAISSVAGLANDSLRALLAREPGETPNCSTLIQPLLDALAEFDYVGLNDHLGRIAAVLPPSEIVSSVVLPVMREVGERWHSGQLRCSQEHMMSCMMQHLLGTLLRLYRPAPGAPGVLFTTPEGEMHALGILAAAILAAGEGLSPVYLGPSLPPKEIIYAVRRSGVKAVVLQLMDTNVQAADQLRQVCNGLPAGVEIWLGGSFDFKQEGATVIPDFTTLTQHYRRLAVQ